MSNPLTNANAAEGDDDVFDESVPRTVQFASRRKSFEAANWLSSAPNTAGAEQSLAQMRPRQDVDEEERKQKELRAQLHRVRFYHHGNHFVLNKRHSAMFCLKGDSDIRMRIFRFVDSPWFYRAINLFIAVNALVTILDTPGIRSADGVPTTIFALDIMFQIVFTLEILLKFCALGVVAHRHSYFRTPSNTIDFLVVIIGFVVFFVDTDLVVRLVRLVRSMRALGALTRVALLKSIFIALRNATHQLRDVLLLMSFVVVGMAVLGLQLFVGTFDQKCYYQVPINLTESNATMPFIDPAQSQQLCSNNPDSGHECATGTSCEIHRDQFRIHYLNFNNIGNAVFLVFKMVTLDNWPSVTKLIQESNGVTYFSFSVVVVLFGGFFAINLVLAILSGEYEEVTEAEEKRLEMELKTRQAVLDAQGFQQESTILDEGVKEIEELSLRLSKLRLTEAEATDAIEMELALGAKSESNFDMTNPELPDDDADDTVHNLDNQATPSNAAPPAALDQPIVIVENADGVPSEQQQQSRRRSQVAEMGLLTPEPSPAKSQASPTKQTRAEVRAKSFGCASCFRRFRRAVWMHCVGQVWFRNLSLVVTMINIVVLATDHYGIDRTWDTVNDWINFGCSIYFLCEAFLKILTMLITYFRDPFNIFDLLLCALSIPEMALAGSGSGSSLSALRAFRLARVMRVVNSSQRVRQLLITVGNAAFATAFLFLFLFVYVMYAGLFAVIVFPDAVAPEERPNYTNFPNAILSMFIVLSGENWVDETVKVMLGANPAFVAFFVMYFILGNYCILNFVVVILISSYNQAAELVVMEDSARAEDGMDEAAKMLANQRQPEPRERLASFQVASFDADEASKSTMNVPPADQRDSLENSDRKQLAPGAGDLAVTSLEPTPEEGARTHIQVGPSDPTSHSNLEEHQHHPATHERRLSFVPDVETKPIENRTTSIGEDLIQDSTSVSSFFAMKLRRFRAFSCSGFLADLFGLPHDQEAVYERLTGNSLFVLAPDNIFRRVCARIVTHPYFEALVIIVVLQSCVSLGLDNAENRKDPQTAQLLDFNIIFLVAFFSLECLLKWISFGVIQGEFAYFRDGWNRLDFFILLVSILAIFLPVRAVQALRVFRLASKWASMRVVIASLVYAVPGIANVFVLVAFFFLVAGILGVQLFKGTFGRCNDDSIEFKHDCLGQYNITSTEVALTNGFFQPYDVTSVKDRHWLFSFYNFNHLGKGALSLTVLMYGDGWTNILYDVMDSRDIDQSEKMNSSAPWGIGVVVLMIIGNFFLNNLFVGSLMDSFSSERKRAQGTVDDKGHPLLSEQQERWIREYRFASAAQLPILVPKPMNPVRKFFCWVYFADKSRTEPRWVFEFVITVLILLNLVVMMSAHDGQPQYWTDFLYRANIFFTACFTLEFVIKMIALLPFAYFHEPWNIFDFLVLVAAYLSIFADGPGTNAVRVARVARILRLVRRARGLYRLFQSLVYALPQLFNVSVLLGLILFIFGVAGTNLFEDLHAQDSDDGALGQFFNFKNVGYSMMLLFQIGTTEAWADVLTAATANEYDSDCSEAAGTCGTWLAYPFFLTFMLCANSVAINLFIFIVVDNYEEVNLISDKLSQLLLFRLSRFRRLWVAIDTERDGLVSWEGFVVIVRQLHQTIDQEYEEFVDDWGIDEDENKPDEDLGDVSDDPDNEDEPASPGFIRPTTADFRNIGVLKVLGKALGMNAFNQTEIQNDEMIKSAREIDRMALNDRFFLQKVKEMEIPVGEGGRVNYDDCLYGIVKEFYHVDVDQDARVFLSTLVDYDPNAVFMVHHALAITKIRRALVKRKERRLLGAVNATSDKAKFDRTLTKIDPSIIQEAAAGAQIEGGDNPSPGGDGGARGQVPVALDDASPIKMNDAADGGESERRTPPS